jgi:hypothetical protein
MTRDCYVSDFLFIVKWGGGDKVIKEGKLFDQAERRKSLLSVPSLWSLLGLKGKDPLHPQIKLKPLTVRRDVEPTNLPESFMHKGTSQPALWPTQIASLAPQEKWSTIMKVDGLNMCQMAITCGKINIEALLYVPQGNTVLLTKW